MPPFFSLAAVPLGQLDRVSPYLARIVWIALTWASIVLALDLIARMIYGKRLRLEEDESSLEITSSELLVPFLLALPFIVSNFELLQVNMILFTLALWGLFLQANGRNAAGGIAIAAAAAMKVMAIAFLPYLLYRKRWRAALWTATATLFFSITPGALSWLGEVFEGRRIVAFGPSGKFGLRKRGAIRLFHVGSHFGLRVHSIRGSWNIYIANERRSKREAGLGDLVRRRGRPGRCRVSRSAAPRSSMGAGRVGCNLCCFDNLDPRGAQPLFCRSVIALCAALCRMAFD